MVETTPGSEKGTLIDFFSASRVLEAYCASADFRDGEKYVFDAFLQPGSLLDCGCGAGRTTFLLAERFDPIDAFDIVPSMIDHAIVRQRKLGTNIRFRVADATALPFATASHDNAIFSYNGIEGIGSDALRERALREVHRVLKPGGRFVFSTKSIFNWGYVRDYRIKGRIKRVLSRAGLFHPAWRGLGPNDILHHENGQLVRLHTTNPFRMTRLLRRIGFRVLYFNSEVRLGAGEHLRSWAAYFDPWDHFYACEKRG